MFLFAVHVIAREFQLSPQGPWLARHYSIAENKFREFQLGDIMYFARSGIEVCGNCPNFMWKLGSASDHYLKSCFLPSSQTWTVSNIPCTGN